MVHWYVFLILNYVYITANQDLKLTAILLLLWWVQTLVKLFVAAFFFPNWHRVAVVVVSKSSPILLVELGSSLKNRGMSELNMFEIQQKKHSTSFFAAPQVTNLEHALPNRTSTLIQVQIGTRTGFMILLRGNIRISNIFSCKVRC